MLPTTTVGGTKDAVKKQRVWNDEKKYILLLFA